MNKDKRPLGRILLSIASLTLGFSLLLVSTQPAFSADPCPTCVHHDGKTGALIPKEAPTSDDPSATSGGADNALYGGTETTTLKTGTQGTLLRTGTEGTLLRTGTDGALLQTGTQNTMIQAGIEHQAQPLNIEILIDCSQSMKEGLGGPLSPGHEEKMNAAKKVLEQTMQNIPSDVNVGLRVFGQSFTNDPYVDCQQTALLVPIGVHNRRTIVERVSQIRPFGLTPLTYALREAGNDLMEANGLKQIILISDGAETCGQDPCAMVRYLTSHGINMKIDIVALGIKRSDFNARDQLNCIANSTGGKYYDANTTAELVDSIRQAVKQAVGESKVSGKVLTKLKPDAIEKMPADLR